MIRGLLEAGNADVLLALWPPKGLHWATAEISSQPTIRLLGVHRGNRGSVGEEVMKLMYDLAEPTAEREAWRLLLEALRKG
ncbi:MAG: hypothetical protein IT305_07800 [Chloroflexi bacterium]|nr:hypothetical protein [Chloroflexota bacterium]